MPDGTLGNGLDNAAFDGLIGDLSWCPVRYRTLTVLGTLTSDGNNRTDLLWCIRRRRPRARAITQAFVHILLPSL